MTAGLLAVLALAGCAHDPAPRRFNPGQFELGAQDVAAGSTVEVWLERSLATDSSVPGQALTARVLGPVRGTSGDVVIPLGALLYGRVVGLASGANPSISMAFDRAETVHGVLSLDARARATARTTERSSARPRRVPSGRCRNRTPRG
jgi:hypothetical protein